MMEITRGVVPKMRYAGDELIDDTVYAECMEGRYGSLVTGVVGAAESFGLTVDDDTFERWKRVTVAAGMLDTFLDDSPDHAAAVSLYKQQIAYIRGKAEEPEAPSWADTRLRPMIDLLQSSFAVLPEERREVLLTAADLIADISVAKAKTAEVKEYNRLLKLEGQLSGLLISESVSDSVYNHPNFPLFAAWAVRAMEAGIFADSSVDLKRDHADKLTSVRPTIINQARVAIGGLTGARSVLHAHNRKAVIAALKANHAG